MLSAQIQRRRKALRLLRTVGAEVSREHGKGQLQQLIELGLLGLRGYSASDYYVLGLYRDYRQASRYMTRSQFDKVRRQWNPPSQGIVEFNKWIFGNYCTSIGIPTPQCYGLFHARVGLTVAGNPLRDCATLAAVFSSTESGIAIKPIAGSHGNDVMVVDRFDVATGNLKRANGKSTTLQELHQLMVDKGFPWVLQAKVTQHEALRALHAASLNTARIITLLDHEGDVQILGAVLRIGTGSAEIDNTTGGGVAAPIDLATGACDAAVSESTIRRITHHPDSSLPIEGFVVPEWERMKATAIEAHKRLPFARSLGWDVALGDSGPTVLEVNGTWYQNHVQMTGTSLWDTAFADLPDASVGIRGR